VKTFALVENNIVINVSIGNDDWQKENWIDCKNARVGIGYSYDLVNDVFIAPQPYPSWSLDQNFNWQAPISKPIQGFWYWDEEIGNWVETAAL